jgi:hypothetical protein
MIPALWHIIPVHSIIHIQYIAFKKVNNISYKCFGTVQVGNVKLKLTKFTNWKLKLKILSSQKFRRKMKTIIEYGIVLCLFPEKI